MEALSEYWNLAAAGLALLVTCLFIVGLRPVAYRLQLVDRTGGQGVPNGEVPVVGGIAMFLGLVAGIVVVDTLPAFISVFLVSCGVLIVVGALDDRYSLPAAIRLAGQGFAALLMVLVAGNVLADLGNLFFFGLVELGPIALVFTVLVTLTSINAFNMLDGMDGLAGGTALVIFSFFAAIAWVGGDSINLYLILVLTSIVIGFLVFNIPIRGRNGSLSFMGDAGSTFLGFAIAWVGIALCQGEARAMTPITGLWIAAVPLFDIYGSFIRRLLRRHSPLRGDRDHLHHILQNAGFSVPASLLILLGTSAICGIIGLTGLYVGVPEGLMFVSLILFGTAYHWLIRRLGRFTQKLEQRAPQLSRDLPS